MSELSNYVLKFLDKLKKSLPQKRKAIIPNRLLQECFSSFSVLKFFYSFDEIIHFVSHRRVGEFCLFRHFFDASAGEKKVENEILVFSAQFQKNRKFIISIHVRFARRAFHLANIECVVTAWTNDWKFHFIKCTLIKLKFILTKLKINLDYQNIIINIFWNFISNYLCGRIFHILQTLKF